MTSSLTYTVGSRRTRDRDRRRSSDRPLNRFALGLAAGLALACLGLVLATRTSSFYADDFLNFGLARQQGLSLSFLKLDVFGELAPGHRLLDWLVGAHLGVHWPWALGILMFFWLLGVVAFERAAEELFESRRLVALTTLFFASSPGFVRVIQWWASGEHLVPSISLTVVALAASLRWFRTRSLRALIVAGIGYLGALMFYTKPALFLLYLAMLAYFVPSRVRTPRFTRSRLSQDAPLFGVLAGITVIYVVAVRTGGYLQLTKAATIGTWIHYYALDWFKGVTPWIIGQTSIPNSAAVSIWVDVTAQALLVVVVVASLARRRSAWRAWAFYVVAWLANGVIVGNGRLGAFGPGVGFDPRYNLEMALLLALTIGLAFSPPVATGIADSTSIPGSLTARPCRLGLGLFGLVVAGGFAASLGVSYARLSTSWPAGQAGSWVDNFRASIRDLRRRGIDPSVIDAPVPQSVEPGGAAPFNMLSTVLPELDSTILVDDQRRGDPAAVVVPDGRAQLVVGRRLAGGNAPAELRAGVFAPQLGATGSIRQNAFCISAQHATALLQFRPRNSVIPQFGVLDVRLQRNVGHGVVFVYVDDGTGYPVAPTKTFTINHGDTVLRTELPAARFMRARLDLEVGSAACIQRVSIVDYNEAATVTNGR